MQFFEWMEYTEDLTFGHCEGNNGRIYECVVLGQYCESMKILIVEYKIRYLEFWLKMNVQKKILYICCEIQKWQDVKNSLTEK